MATDPPSAPASDPRPPVHDRSVDARKSGSGRIARPFAWTAGAVMFAMAFLSEALPPQRLSFVEPYLDYKWVEVEQVINVSPFAPFRGPLIVATTLLLVTWGISAYFNNRSKRKAGIEIDDERVLLTYRKGWPKRRALALEDIGAAQSPEPSTLEVHLRTGAKITVTTRKAEELAADIEARRAAAAALPAGLGWHAIPWGGAMRWVWALGGFYALVSMLGTAGEAVAGGLWPAGVLAWLAALLWLVVGFTLSSRTDVVVGADGVRVSHPWRSQFVPYHLVDDVSVDGGVLRLVRKAGRDISISSRNTKRLEADLRRALDRYHNPEAGGADHHLDALARGDKSAAGWQRELERLLGQQDYRGPKLRVADLEQLLGDGQADPERRVAAALALPKDDETRRRIRIAADRCADEDTAAALAAAAADTVAEAELTRAVERFRDQA